MDARAAYFGAAADAQFTQPPKIDWQLPVGWLRDPDVLARNLAIERPWITYVAFTEPSLLGVSNAGIVEALRTDPRFVLAAESDPQAENRIWVFRFDGT